MFAKIEINNKIDLWTLDGKQENKASSVVISSHGRQTVMNSNFRVPVGTDVQFYCPHGYTLQDPTLLDVLQGKVMPCEQIGGGGSSYDYVLSRYQGAENGSSLEHESRIPDLGATRDELIGRGFSGDQLLNFPERPTRDLITIRPCRFWKEPTLSEVIAALRDAGFEYATIHCSFCRSPSLRSEKGSFDATTGSAAR